MDRYTITYYRSQSSSVIMRSLPLSFDACCKRLAKYGYSQNPCLPCIWYPTHFTRRIVGDADLVQIEKY